MSMEQKTGNIIPLYRLYLMIYLLAFPLFGWFCYQGATTWKAISTTLIIEMCAVMLVRYVNQKQMKAFTQYLQKILYQECDPDKAMQLIEAYEKKLQGIPNIFHLELLYLKGTCHNVLRKMDQLYEIIQEMKRLKHIPAIYDVYITQLELFYAYHQKQDTDALFQQFLTQSDQLIARSRKWGRKSSSMNMESLRMQLDYQQHRIDASTYLQSLLKVDVKSLSRLQQINHHYEIMRVYEDLKDQKNAVIYAGYIVAEHVKLPVAIEAKSVWESQGDLT